MSHELLNREFYTFNREITKAYEDLHDAEVRAAVAIQARLSDLSDLLEDKTPFRTVYNSDGIYRVDFVYDPASSSLRRENLRTAEVFYTKDGRGVSVTQLERPQLINASEEDVVRGKDAWIAYGRGFADMIRNRIQAQ